MLKSMTGFGKAECELPGKKISVEIKTLNSKQFDISLRFPNIYKQKELDVRALLIKKLQRGKIDVNLMIDHSETVENYSINKPLVKKYYDDVKLLAGELNINTDGNIISTLLKLPDVLKSDEQALDDDDWGQILQCIEVAMNKCDEFRSIEGRKLDGDFRERIALILGFLKGIQPFEEGRISKIKAKFKKDLTDVTGKHKIDENRFEQEIIYYLEKIDITEEKVRLKNNCEYFLQAIDENGSNGKKLIFISQEIGREVNTIGSKANDSDIQKLVVQMKDELEKIKEQLFNIL